MINKNDTALLLVTKVIMFVNNQNAGDSMKTQNLQIITLPYISYIAYLYDYIIMYRGTCTYCGYFLFFFFSTLLLIFRRYSVRYRRRF